MPLWSKGKAVERNSVVVELSLVPAASLQEFSPQDGETPRQQGRELRTRAAQAAHPRLWALRAHLVQLGSRMPRLAAWARSFVTVQPDLERTCAGGSTPSF